MSAPERIYRTNPNYDSEEPEGAEYIRADIHEAEIDVTQTALRLMNKTAEIMNKEIDALKAELALAKELLDRWYNDSDIPDSNCSCHISPPCGDCVNWGGLRETASETKKLLGMK